MPYADLLRAALNQMLPLDTALEFLRSSGASPIEAAAAVQEATGTPFDAARELVTRSRAWTGPRSSAQPQVSDCVEWYGAIGQHGRSGHGAASVLPHLVRQAQTQGAAEQAGRGAH